VHTRPLRTAQTTRAYGWGITIAEAKERLEASLGVDPTSIKITIEDYYYKVCSRPLEGCGCALDCLTIKVKEVGNEQA